MKQSIFLKYALAFLVVILAGFFILIGQIWLLSTSYFATQEEKALEDATESVARTVAAMIDVSQKDFQYLLDEELELLQSTLESARGENGRELFLTDGSGKVLFSTDAAFSGTLSSACMTESAQAARQGWSFVGDLDGFLQEKRLCRVILLEKKYTEVSKQRVGAVFLIQPEKNTVPFVRHLMVSLLFAVTLVLMGTVFFFLLLIRRLVLPLQRLNDAAVSFARGEIPDALPEEKGGEIIPLIRTFNQTMQTVKANETLRQNFISNVSHDLRTPLTTIGGFVQNMKEGAIPPERQDHYFDIVLAEVNRLSRLVQTLLETSRLASGERKYDFLPMDICELGRVTLLSFENRLEEKEVDVSFECEKDSIFVNADRDAIAQVMYNLLDNAVKFVPQKGSLSIKIVTQKSKKALFAVRNSGEGIPPEELSQLFDRFYKSDRSRGLDKTGMGLGLFIAKSIISAHGEEIWVESRVKDYTELIFSLPLSLPPEA